jgi:Adenylate and Guanylate cyclase catalytic domain
MCTSTGQTQLAERLGLEGIHGLVNGFLEVALAEVHRYEGTVHQFLGDGFMALFGAPLAHEDHARRAALAALGIARVLREQPIAVAEGVEITLTVRMGLHTGFVVVGAIRAKADAAALGAAPAGWRASLALARLLDATDRPDEARAAYADARRLLDRVAAGLTGAPDLLRGFQASPAYREAAGS